MQPPNDKPLYGSMGSGGLADRLYSTGTNSVLNKSRAKLYKSSGLKSRPLQRSQADGNEADKETLGGNMGGVASKPILPSIGNTMAFNQIGVERTMKATQPLRTQQLNPMPPELTPIPRSASPSKSMSSKNKIIDKNGAITVNRPMRIDEFLGDLRESKSDGFAYVAHREHLEMLGPSIRAKLPPPLPESELPPALSGNEMLVCDHSLLTAALTVALNNVQNNAMKADSSSYVIGSPGQGGNGSGVPVGNNTVTYATVSLNGVTFYTVEGKANGKNQKINANNIISMQNSGVNIVSQNSSVSVDFIPLEQYEQEERQFYSLVKIKYFRYFRVRKAFLKWIKTVRKSKMSDASEFLNQNLFLLSRHLRRCLFFTKEKCIVLEKYRFNTPPSGPNASSVVGNIITAILGGSGSNLSLPFAVGKQGGGQQQANLFDKHNKISPKYSNVPSFLTLDEYNSFLRNSRLRLAKFLEETLNSIAENIEQACADVFNEKFPKNQSANDAQKQLMNTLLKKSTGTNQFGITNTLMDSRMPEESSNVSYVEHTARLNLCRRLTNFLRFIDYILSSSLYNMCINIQTNVLGDVTCLSKETPPEPSGILVFDEKTLDLFVSKEKELPPKIPKVQFKPLLVVVLVAKRDKVQVKALRSTSGGSAPNSKALKGKVQGDKSLKPSDLEELGDNESIRSADTESVEIEMMGEEDMEDIDAEDQEYDEDGTEKGEYDVGVTEGDGVRTGKHGKKHKASEENVGQLKEEGDSDRTFDSSMETSFDNIEDNGIGNHHITVGPIDEQETNRNHKTLYTPPVKLNTFNGDFSIVISGTQFSPKDNVVAGITPTAMQFFEKFEDASEALIAIVCSIKHFSTHDKFKNITSQGNLNKGSAQFEMTETGQGTMSPSASISPTKQTGDATANDGPDIASFFISSDRYKTLSVDCVELLRIAYEQTASYVVNFKPYFDVCNYCLHFDRVKYCEEFLLVPEGMPVPSSQEYNSLSDEIKREANEKEELIEMSGGEEGKGNRTADSVPTGDRRSRQGKQQQKMSTSDEQKALNLETVPPFKSKIELVDIERITESVKHLERCTAMINAMPELIPINIFAINLSQLKQVVSGMPENVVSFLREILPICAKIRTESLLIGINRVLRRLEVVHESVPDFVNFHNYVEALGNYGLGVIEKVSHNMEQLIDLLYEFKIPISISEQILYNKILPSLDLLKTKLVFCQTTMSTSQANWVKKLQTQSAQLDASAKRMAQLADEIRYNKISAEHETITNELRGFLNTMEDYKKQSREFNAYEETLGTAQTRWENLDDALELLRLRFQMWDSIGKLEQFKKTLYITSFNELNVDGMTKDLQDLSKIAFRAERGLPENDIVPAIKQKLVEYKHLLPLITDLKNPDMKLKHFEDIEKLLTTEIPTIRELFVALESQSAEKGMSGASSSRAKRPQPSKKDDDDHRNKAKNKSGAPGEEEAEGSNEEEEQEKLTFGWFLDHDILKHRDKVNEISVLSSGESSLKQMLEGVANIWKTQNLTVSNYNNRNNMFIITGVEDVIALLEDSIATVGTISSSRYVVSIEQEVDFWAKTLNTMSETLTEWINVQKQYLYLENIFSAPDIQRQLANESKLFGETDMFWRKTMGITRDYPNVQQATTASNMKATLLKHLGNLNDIQKGLDDYLERKRFAFPRFYFLSADELLEILCQTKNIKAIIPFLPKLFEGVSNLNIEGMNPNASSDGSGGGNANLDICSLISPEGEVLNLVKKVKIRGNIEIWLKMLEEKMRESVKEEAKREFLSHNFGQDEFNFDKTGPPSDITSNVHLGKALAQILATISQVRWAFEIERCLQAKEVTSNQKKNNEIPDFKSLQANRSLSSLKNKNMSGRIMMQRNDSSSSVDLETTQVAQLKAFLNIWKQRLTNLVVKVRTNLTKLQRKSISTLITIDVHSRDTLEQLVNSRVCDIEDFEWQKRLRYYFNLKSGDLLIRQINAELVYRCEYLGACGCLVITPLTDRCYITLTGALHMKLGGAPAGPAGTGKTETTKDLGRAVGVQCVVFNCSESLDYVMMGQFFSGLAQCGAWACFDEFNRIEIDVLSVIAQQILTIREGIIAGRSTFIFEGKEMALDPHIGIFITMNPTYAGRTELPDNLKALFRGVAMLVPDYALIAEIILFSEGFEQAKVLSSKMVQLYKLSSEQLSQQDHYDFGMRALKAVLVMAGQLKRMYASDSEDVVLIRAMRDSNIPKFLKEDIVLFMGIVQDLFPNVKIPEISQEELKNGITKIYNFAKDLRNVYISKLIPQGKGPGSVAGGNASVGGTTARKPVGNVTQRMVQQTPQRLAVNYVDSNYTFNDKQLAKCIELYDTLNVRHGVMLVGPSGGGKSTVRKLLADSLSFLNEQTQGAFPKVMMYTINPKSVTMGELFGEFNEITHEWRDGLIPYIVRDIMRDENSKLGSGQLTKYWLTFDGPVDTCWIENMNTVLDDNKTLCLANSERIRLSENLSILFEVGDLKQASPATVSRCGMVYVDTSQNGWRPFAMSWIDGMDKEKCFIRDANIKRFTISLFEKYMPICLEFISNSKVKEVIHSSEVQFAQSVCRYFTSTLLNSYANKQAEIKMANALRSKIDDPDEKAKVKVQDMAIDVRFLYTNGHIKVMESLIKKVFIYSLVWGFGGSFITGEMVVANKVGGGTQGTDAPNSGGDGGNTEQDTDGSGQKEEQKLIPAGEFFDSFIRDLFSSDSDINIPGAGTIFDYYVDWSKLNRRIRDVKAFKKDLDPNEEMTDEIAAAMNINPSLISFESFESIIPSYDFGEYYSQSNDGGGGRGRDAKYFRIFIPTVDNFRTMCNLYNNIMAQFPILVTGESGTGKTSVVKSLLQSINQSSSSTQTKLNVINIIFSAQTSAYRVQKSIEARLTIRSNRGKGGVDAFSLHNTLQSSLLTSLGKQTAIFIDNLNMPNPEIFTACPAHEILRQVCCDEGFFGRESSGSGDSFIFRAIQNPSIICCSLPMDNGRNPITARLTRHFVPIHLDTQTASNSMPRIFTTILAAHFAQSTFDDSIANRVRYIVQVLTGVYNETVKKIRPTPNKLHYTFNMRDVSRIIFGITQYNNNTIAGSGGSSSALSSSIADIVSFETQRVMMDRLLEEDKPIFFNILSNEIKDALGVELKVSEQKENSMEVMTQPVFCNFMNMGIPTESRVIAKVPSYPKLADVLTDYMNEYNLTSNEGGSGASKTQLSLVFFVDCMNNVVRTAKVLSAPRGNALLIGIGGSGKRSTARLSSAIADTELFTLTPQGKSGGKGSPSYRPEVFRDDIKTILYVCGKDGKPSTLLINDSDIVDDSQLEDINSLLNSGEIPECFDTDETDEIINEMRKVVRSSGAIGNVSIDRNYLLDLFCNRVLDNLHVVLCMSPSDPAFKRRLRLFPSIVNNSTCIYFQQWPKDALMAVGEKYMSCWERKIKKSDGTSETKQLLTTDTLTLSKVFVAIHSSVLESAARYTVESGYVYNLTPANYIELLMLFNQLLSNKLTELDDSLNKYKNGLVKLQETNDQVKILSGELEVLKPKLEESRNTAGELIVRLREETEKVEELRRATKKEEAMFQAQTSDVEQLAAEAQQDLDRALPALNEAVRAVNALSKSDISEVKAFTNPPPLVMTVMEAVCIIFGEKPDWASAKVLLSDASFINKLLAFDKDSISEVTIKKLQKYIGDPQFNPDAVSRVSVAATSICMWVRAIDTYAHVNKEVLPKKTRLATLQAELSEKLKTLNATRATLSSYEEKLGALNSQFERENSKKEKLEAELKLTECRFVRADQLTRGLKNEHARWQERVCEVERSKTTAVGDTILGSSGVIYFGQFNRYYRDVLIGFWVRILDALDIKYSKNPLGGSPTLPSILTTQIILQDHHAHHLPSDLLSEENAVIAFDNVKPPLFIDPFGQALAWLKGANEGCKIIKIGKGDGEADWARSLEAATRSGSVVVIEGVGENISGDLETVVEWVKQRNNILNSSNLFMFMNEEEESVATKKIPQLRLGDALIDVPSSFKIFLVTKLSNPKYTPETTSKVNIINFSITYNALDEQLLSTAVLKLLPSLELERKTLLLNLSADQKLLAELEIRILSELSMSTGNVLDNEALINTLTESKKTAEAVEVRVKLQLETNKRIDKERQGFKPLACRGTVIFFCLNDMGSRDPMYKWSLEYFANIYEYVLTNAVNNTPTQVTGETGQGDKYVFPIDKLDGLIQNLTITAFNDICISLFEKDKLLFGVLLASRILMRNGDVAQDIWDVFIRGEVAANSVLERYGQKAEGIQSPIAVLAHIIPELGPVVEHIKENMEIWMRWCKAIKNSSGSASEDNEEEESEPGSGKATKKEKGPDPFDDMAYYKIPPELEEVLPTLVRLYIVRFLDISAFLVACRKYIVDVLGEEFVDTKPNDVGSLLTNETISGAVMLVLGPGADPQECLTRACNDTTPNKVKGGERPRLISISLGRGQLTTLKAALQSAVKEGNWLLVMNLHLVPVYGDFLDEWIENNISSQSVDGGGGSNNRFRLFISTSPSTVLADSLIKRTRKITMETPKGIRNNMQSALNIARSIEKTNPKRRQKDEEAETDENYNNGTSSQDDTQTQKTAFPSLTFPLCIFHSILVSRLDFVPLTMSTRYEFNECDLRAALETLSQEQELLERQPATGGDSNLDAGKLPSLRYVTASIHYGGRVTDDWDRRGLEALMRKYYTKMSIHGGGDIGGLVVPETSSPQSKSIDSLLSFINDPNFGLTTTSTSKILHLAPFVLTARLKMEGKELLDSLLTVGSNKVESLSEQQSEDEERNDSDSLDGNANEGKAVPGPKEGAGDVPGQIPKFDALSEEKQSSGDSYVIKIMSTLLSILPPSVVVPDSSECVSPLDVVLKHESTKYNKLIGEIKAVFNTLKSAILGFIVMSAEVEQIYNAVFMNKVPGKVAKASYPTLRNLSDYVRNIACRIQFINRWRGGVTQYWMGGMFFPQGFITGVMQTFSRKYSIAIDTLSLKFEVMGGMVSDVYTGDDQQGAKGGPKPPQAKKADKEASSEDGVVISGLFLEGGLLEGRYLKMPGDIRGENIPPIRFLPYVETQSDSSGSSDTIYICPLYRNSARAGELSTTGHSTNFILPVKFPIHPACLEGKETAEQAADDFILTGTALVCELDE